MSYSTYDTDWKKSAKGNWWRRLHGVVLTVGKNSNPYYDDRYWVSIDGKSLGGNGYRSLKIAQMIAEIEARTATGNAPKTFMGIDIDELLGTALETNDQPKK